MTGLILVGSGPAGVRTGAEGFHPRDSTGGWEDMSLDYATRALDDDDLRQVRSRKPAPGSQTGASRPAFDRDLIIGDWLVQPGLDRISREGADLRLRPQVMNMLVCLARGRGRTISREQILDEVWPDQSVADTSIARCVAELRKALGDRVQAPAVIETIPKRGYRLIAPVSDVTDSASRRHSTNGFTGTMPRGAGRGELKVVAGPTSSPATETHPTADGPIETRPPTSEPPRAVTLDDSAPTAVAVPGDDHRRATGFMWFAGLVAAVAALLWPPASR
jgi:DNA-binding winged helix-turn-helix (wHTH) protein